MAYALAGDADRDILAEPVAHTPDGRPVHLAEIWPTGQEIDDALALASRAADYAPAYDEAEANPVWGMLDAPGTALYPWDPASTYIRRPPFAAVRGEERLGAYVADPIIVVGDDITTDHISPAGAVSPRSEAAAYLIARGRESARPQRLLGTARQLGGHGPRSFHEQDRAQPSG